MMLHSAAEKRSSFEPLIPNEETVEAMVAAHRGELVAIAGLSDLVANLNTDALQMAVSMGPIPSKLLVRQVEGIDAIVRQFCQK